MKKQFFYAAFALAMMASCTSEENFPVDPVNPTPEEEKVAIKLGIDSPTLNATVDGRSVGSVGDVEAEKNKWNGQKLYIAMIDRATGLLAQEKVTEGTTQVDKPIMSWDSYNYMAPRKTEQGGQQQPANGSGNIRIYQKDKTPTTPEGEGTIQYLYYPVNGTYDFYGWHLDDAEITTSTDAAPNPSIAGTATTTEISIKGITINGSQDIMGAKTKEANSNTYTNWDDALATWAFSARTARNEIDPILKFEHKLARLKFFVRAGSYSAALYNEDGTKKSSTGQYASEETGTGAMYVTGIVANQMHKTFDMTLNNTKIILNNPSNKGTLTLGSYDEDANKIVNLKPVAPNYHKDWNQALAQGVTSKEAEVGESIMFLPVAGEGTTVGTDKEISLTLSLKQLVQLTEDETNSTNNTYGYKEQSADVTVKAEHVKIAEGQYATAFEAGNSYNVYITIYGFERIEVSAELTAWKDGGDVEVDIEEGESNNSGNASGNQTPAQTKDVAFTISGLSESETATITIGAENKTFTFGGENVSFTLPAAETANYTVAASGYFTTTGTIATDATTATVSLSKEKAFTFTITNDNPTNPSITVIEVDEQGTQVGEALTGTNNVFNLTFGKKYKYTASADDLTTKSEIITANNELANTIEITLTAAGN